MKGSSDQESVEKRLSFNKRDNLVEQYRSLALAVAWSILRRFGIPTDLSGDMIGAAYLGLVEAASRFEEGGRTDFSAYARVRIQGAVIDALRRSSGLKRTMYRRLKSLQVLQEMQELAHGYGLEDLDYSAEEANASGEVAEELEQSSVRGKSQKSLRQSAKSRVSESEAALEQRPMARALTAALEAATIFNLVSLDEAILDGQLIDHDTPLSSLESHRDSELLRQLVLRLPTNEREIIEKYYFGGMSFAQICRESPRFNKSWVSRLHKRGLQRIRQWYDAELSGLTRVKRKKGKKSLAESAGDSQCGE